jgi:hypothetical protein
VCGGCLFRLTLSFLPIKALFFLRFSRRSLCAQYTPNVCADIILSRPCHGQIFHFCKLVDGSDRRLVGMPVGRGGRGSRGRGRGSQGGGFGSSHAGSGRPTQNVYVAGPSDRAVTRSISEYRPEPLAASARVSTSSSVASTITIPRGMERPSRQEQHTPSSPPGTPANGSPAP